MQSNSQQFKRGSLAMMPLSLIVLPWGVLTGSLAMDAGLSELSAAAMSLLVFAGAAQLVALGLIKAGAGVFTILLTTLFITSRHFLYGVAMRSKIANRPLKWRLSLGFLLTDELFAVCGMQRDEDFNCWFALGAGLSFYIAWNLSTIAGIVLASQVPELSDYGLEFAIAAIFIAMVAPGVKTWATVTAVTVSLVLSVVLSFFAIPAAIVLASLVAMTCAYGVDRWERKQ